MIKIIATDMDHTLLNDESILPEEFSDVITHLEGMNIEFVCASGRSLNSLHKKVLNDKNRLNFVSDNGSVVEHHGKIIYKSILDQKDWHQMVIEGRISKETSISLTTIESSYIEVHNDEHRQMLQEYYPNFNEVDDLTKLDLEVIKVTYLSLGSNIENFDRISPIFSDNFNAVRAGHIWIDIMNKGVNKGNGLKILLEQFSLTSDNLMAFGDFHNDIEMLKLANYSYAVSNAHEDVKEVAKQIIGSNNDNSVIKHIKEHVIKEK